MKKLIVVIFTTVFLSGCIVTKSASSIIGQFSGPTYWMGKPMNISLFQNNIFHLNWVGKDYTGTWGVIAKNQVLLKFDKITDLSILLGSGSLNGDDKIIYFINQNKIKMDDFILKRIK